jgi:hypothetical protein
MKNSTILFVFGILGLGGVGAYLYLKNKKAPTTPTTPPSSTTPPSGATPPISATSVSDSSLGLTTTTPSTDEQKNYLQAKELARLLLLYNAKTLNDEFKLLATKNGFSSTSNRLTPGYILIPMFAPKKINELGYKLLPNYDIEKM